MSMRSVWFGVVQLGIEQIRYIYRLTCTRCACLTASCDLLVNFIVPAEVRCNTMMPVVLDACHSHPFAVDQ